MAKYNIGDSVIEVNSNRNGRVISVGEPSRGRQIYEVLFINTSSTEFILEAFLQKDFDISDPFERCVHHMFGSYIDFARVNISYKIENSSNSIIASLKASKTIFKPYQFKPLLKFLNSENKRLLVADEVGLGKTIEAGHIMLEMLARKELTNVLIVCPKSLRQKWVNELESKFNLKFRIYDDVKDFESDIKLRNGSFRGIINYERIQMPANTEEQNVNNRFVSIIRKTGILFSLILCDEAHKMRNDSTATYRGAMLLSDVAKAMLFLTATPIMISDENLYNLLHILSPIQYDNKVEFHNSLALNQPFLEALRKLRTQKTLVDIASDLESAQVVFQYRFLDKDGTEYYRPQNICIKDFYADNPMYQRTIQSMKSGVDTKEIRAKLQYNITTMSELNSVFSRTRRRDITTDWTQAERRPYRISIELYPEEREIYDDIIEQYIEDNLYTDDWTDEKKMYQGAQLGLVTKKRQVASSVYAYKNEWTDLQNNYDAYADKADKKVEVLKNILSEVFETNGEKKVIVFAIFRKTLQYLKIRLEKVGYKCALIVGGIENRDEELARFKYDDSIKILLSSEVGSEGLDMQFCCSLVNYDLPWNPMVVEQRIGRIDRFGQKSEVVKIYNMVVADSIQEDIYDRLLDRIGIFRQSIGDLEAILDAEHGGDTIQNAYTKLEKELFSNKLTKTERQRKINDIAQAIANEQQQLQKIEENQTNTLTVDTYFQNEINRVLTTHAYLTENELRAYIELLLEKKLPTCTLVSEGDDCDVIVQPKSDNHCILNFVTQNIPNSVDNETALATFRKKVGDRTDIHITFKQEKAYENPEVIYINNTHPLILAAWNYFSEHNNPNERTFVFNIQRCWLPASLSASSYFMVIYSITTTYNVQGAKKETTTQYPILYDWEHNQIIEDNEVVMRFMGQSQVHGFRTMNRIPDFSQEQVNKMKCDLSAHIGYYTKEKREDLEITLRSQLNNKLMQMDKFHTYQEMARLEDLLQRAQSAADNAWTDKERKAAETRIKAIETQKLNAEQRYQEQRQILQRDFELKIMPQLVSINLINIV